MCREVKPPAAEPLDSARPETELVFGAARYDAVAFVRAAEFRTCADEVRDKKFELSHKSLEHLIPHGKKGLIELT